MADIRKIWVRICALGDVPTDKTMGISIGGQQLILARCGDDVYAYQGFCSHMLFPLPGCPIEDCMIRCTMHGSRFDVRDGSVVDWAVYLRLDESILADVRQRNALRAYETGVMDGDVYLAWVTDNPEKLRVRIPGRPGRKPEPVQFREYSA